MLVSFEVENYRSIFERQEISFVASNLKGPTDGLIETAALKNERLVPANLIYGANASGKTNFIKAIDAMISTIIYSHSHGQPGTRIATRLPFLLDLSSVESPTCFECDFIVNDVRYNYGMAFNTWEIENEWLYAFPHGSPRKMFERVGQDFTFGKFLKGKNRTIADLTRNNSLFLSAAAQNSHEFLTTIYDFFRSAQIETNLDMSGNAAERRIKKEHNGEIRDEVISFLRKLNSGISGYRLKEEEASKENVLFAKKLGLAIESVIKEVKSDFALDEDLSINKVVEMAHLGSDGQAYYFPLRYESAGTLQLLSALPKVFEALENGTVLIIDELDLSLHTHAAELLLELFCSTVNNPKHAQILVTTHDTNLLQRDCLRRDQIWFVEKDKIGSSHVYPLTDIKTRIQDDIQKGYLQGRFGAIPI